MPTPEFWPQRIGSAFIRAFRAMLNREIPKDAAAVSYFSLIALFPAMLVLIALADFLFGSFGLPRVEIVQRIVALFPGSRGFLQDNLADLTAPSPAIAISCVFVVIWCSYWVFTFIENAFNRTWGVSRSRPFWESRMRGIMLLALGGMCLLISAVISAVVTAAKAQTNARVPEFAADPIIHWFWALLFLALGTVIAIAVFTLIYKLMPGQKISWFEALCGSVVAAIIWEIASYVFIGLVPYFDYQRVYGKAGTIIALLVWVYTSNYIMLFGANFTAQLHRPEAENPPQKESGASSRPELAREKIRHFPSSR